MKRLIEAYDSENVSTKDFLTAMGAINLKVQLSCYLFILRLPIQNNCIFQVDRQSLASLRQRQGIENVDGYRRQSLNATFNSIAHNVRYV